MTDPDEPEPLRHEPPDVRFEGVGFTHAGGRPLFTGLDLDVPSGTRIGLVGRSGGGKTTLTRLLPRMTDVQEGRILIGGQDISRLRQEDLRGLIAYVPQDPAMFHRTLRENIGFARSGAPDADIRQAAEAAHVTEFADALPHGFDTLVGERGVKLSGGQRQRVALARAILRDEPILLLDEATSALDSESESLVQQALWRQMGCFAWPSSPPSRASERGTVIHRPVICGTVIHHTAIHDSGVKANVPSGPAANGRASITASTLSGP